jgi:aspartyl-tRNA synthetase
MIRKVFKNTMDVELPNPFPVMDFAEAMGCYGSDKPDLRVKLKFTELTDVMKDVDFKVFSGAANMPTAAWSVCACRGRRHATFGNRRLHPVRCHLRRQGSGLHQGQREPKAVTVCSRLSSRTCTTPRWPNLERTGAEDGDLIFFGADKAKSSTTPSARCASRSATATSARKPACSTTSGAAVGDRLPDVRIRRRVDRWTACHHPFTSPKDGHEDLMETDPGACMPRPTTWC